MCLGLTAMSAPFAFWGFGVGLLRQVALVSRSSAFRTRRSDTCLSGDDLIAVIHRLWQCPKTGRVSVDAADFQIAWGTFGDELSRFTVDSLSRSHIPQSAKRFLETAGLPKEAAPFLTFGQASLNWLGRSGQFDGESYYAVGFDGAGNPFAIDSEGTVWLIDHEAPDHMTFVNSSVQTLAECLLTYRKLVVATIAAGGEDAFLDGRIPRGIAEAFSRSVEMADSAAVRSESFWGIELSGLIAETSA